MRSARGSCICELENECFHRGGGERHKGWRSSRSENSRIGTKDVLCFGKSQHGVDIFLKETDIGNMLCSTVMD
jgi:hypothetical protein